VILVEKVGGGDEPELRRQYEDAANPLRGVWGSDPDAWLDALRGGCHDEAS
jgi:hypothetical protein